MLVANFLSIFNPTSLTAQSYRAPLLSCYRSPPLGGGYPTGITLVISMIMISSQGYNACN